MEIISRRIFTGRNIYSHKSVMLISVDINEYATVPTKDIPDFNNRLLSAFPNLTKHTCSLGYEGGFAERLKNGTYLGHVLEHMILDMQNILGFNVKYGKTISENETRDLIVYEYENRECAIECSIDAVDIIRSLIANRFIDTDRIMKRLLALKEHTQPGLSTSAILREAQKRHIPATRLNDENLFRLGYGKYGKLIQATLTQNTSCISADICSDKGLTKSILKDIGVPVPQGYIISSAHSAEKAAVKIGFPVTVKPLDANQGKGVGVNLIDGAQVSRAYYNAAYYSRDVIVEKYIEGSDYRILVVNNKVCAVAKRVAAAVTGDGKSTVEQLITAENKNPLRGEGHSSALTKIVIDTALKDCLNCQNISLDDIPEKDTVIRLRSNGNLSTGGTAQDCTDIIHPDNAEIAVRCAAALGVEVAGIDMIAPDISKSVIKTGGAVIEVNAAPGIRMHLQPSSGKAQNVAKDIVESLCPESEYRFKLAAVTGTNGKTTTVRLISHILQKAGECVGMTNTSGTYIDEKCVAEGDHSGPESARRILSDKRISAAVLEVARGGIIRGGLGYDLADVGVITNIAEDHLGMDGIRTLNDLAYVKSLVAEAVKPQGYTVLNAEDGMTADILDSINNRIIYFYTDAQNIKVPDINSHINVFLDNGFICINDSGSTVKVENIDSIPITFCGLSRCNIENCLAAVSALYAMDVPVHTIAEGLKSFVQNSGRLQFFDMQNYKILVDYAHNFAAYNQAIDLCKKLESKRFVGIIGVPGDRSDESAAKIGKLAADNFNVIYIKEDADLRDRKKGEISELLQQSVAQAGNGNSRVIPNETKALKEAIKNAQDGDLIAVFYERLAPLLKVINTERSTLSGRNRKKSGDSQVS